MESLWLWSSPIGLGVFFAGLGVLIHLCAKTCEVCRRLNEKGKKE